MSEWGLKVKVCFLKRRCCSSLKCCNPRSRTSKRERENKCKDREGVPEVVYRQPCVSLGQKEVFCEEKCRFQSYNRSSPNKHHKDKESQKRVWFEVKLCSLKSAVLWGKSVIKSAVLWGKKLSIKKVKNFGQKWGLETALFYEVFWGVIWGVI